MKQYITLKVGYTAGIYGCSGEYFNTIIINGGKITNIMHYGMYGSDERINRQLEAKGYKPVWVSTDYGQMKIKDLSPAFISEAQAIDEIKHLKF